jgi:glutamyl-Q tRNA(Asp) synthetase
MNDAQSQSVWRFAPSPNGYLHLGHACSALRNFDAARKAGGRFLLRIEDIDLGRARPEFEEAIFEDLAWLGLEWETPVRRQSEHFGEYALAVERLDAQGLIYPCFCTRGGIAACVAASPDWPRDPDGAPVYPGTCRDLSETERRAHLLAGHNAAMRLDTAAAGRNMARGTNRATCAPSRRSGAT